MEPRQAPESRGPFAAGLGKRRQVLSFLTFPPHTGSYRIKEVCPRLLVQAERLPYLVPNLNEIGANLILTCFRYLHSHNFTGTTSGDFPKRAGVGSDDNGCGGPGCEEKQQPSSWG